MQATYLGYPNTTGLASMDYRITDSVADPPGQTEMLHTEHLVRLPDGFFCYLTPTGFPGVAPLPAAAAAGAPVSFAMLTNFSKVRPRTMELWARILSAVPNSRLVLEAKALGDPPTRDATARFFADRGLGGDRVELRGWLNFPLYLRQFEHIAQNG